MHAYTARARAHTKTYIYIYIYTINHIIYYMNTLNAGWTIPVGCSLWQSGTTIRHIKNHPPRPRHLPWACQKGNPWFQNVPDCAVSDRPLVSFRPFPKRKNGDSPPCRGADQWPSCIWAPPDMITENWRKSKLVFLNEFLLFTLW